MMHPGKIMAFAAAILLTACHSATAEVNTAASLAEPVREAIACPAQTFEEFLQEFAADEKIRDGFTAAQVQVTDWRNADEPSEGTKVQQVQKADYRDFTLRFKNGAFHNIAADGTVDQEPQDVQVIKEGDGY